MTYLHHTLQSLINSSVLSCEFSSALKEANVSGLFKKNDRMSKVNYKLISLLTATSKARDFIESFLSPYLYGFRKAYNTQHTLLSLVEKCKTTLDKKGAAGSVIMDLSKAFDCLDHELLIAKLEAYGFGRNALKLLHSYVAGHKQRVLVIGVQSTWDLSWDLFFSIFLSMTFSLLLKTQTYVILLTIQLSMAAVRVSKM